LCVERKRELRQRHVGDVVWLPQAEERGGVVERWRSAERVRLRERETKAGGERARSKAKTAWMKRREAEERTLVLHGNRARVRKE